MRGKTVALAAAVAIGLVLVGGGAHAGHRAYVLHEACKSIRSYADSTGPVQKVGDSAKQYAVLGDSYSTGDILKDRHDAWTYAIAADHGVQLNIVAQSGTGYVNEGFCGDGAYAKRAGSVPDDNSPLIIEGGLNDLQADPVKLKAAADDLVSEFADDRPVIMVGPVNTPAEDGEKRVDRILTAVAAKHHVTYVSGMDWKIQFGSDGKHMSPAGHAAFADDVAAALDL
jgi:acyl-CoA thioesterase-1